MVRTDKQLERIAAVQSKYTNELLKKKHVVGVSIGPVMENSEYTGELALVVMVDQKAPLDQLAPQDRIPSRLDGVRVIVQEIGTPRAG